jgi:hypothetical protein
VYPVNFAFIDGRVSEELYREEHELDYDRLRQSESSEPDHTTEAGLRTDELNQEEPGSQTDDHG